MHDVTIPPELARRLESELETRIARLREHEAMTLTLTARHGRRTRTNRQELEALLKDLRTEIEAAKW